MILNLQIHSVAVKQLESAIWMYAYDFDEVAVHTVAGAAFELYTKRLGLTSFDADIKKYVKPGKLGFFFANWNKNYNFFKHGEYRHKQLAEIEYDEGSVELLLYYATEGNLSGAKEYRLNCAFIYRYYFFLKHPEFFDGDLFYKHLKKPFNDKGISMEVAGDKKTLLIWLNTICNTFIDTDLG